jgi:ribosomal protein S18 acetylase RimI-like enzyme
MLALLDRRPVGMISCLTSDELKKARLLAAVALMRRSELGTAVQARARLAAGALYRLQPDDYYLARIAVLPQEQGHGFGGQLLRVVEGRARASGMKRLTLDVAEEADAAQRFYQGNDFLELGRGEAVDRETGRRLAYLHLGKPLGAKA